MNLEYVLWCNATSCFQARQGKNEDSGESGGDITNYFTENMIKCNV